MQAHDLPSIFADGKSCASVAVGVIADSSHHSDFTLRLQNETVESE